jgi:serine/threonine protein kinase
MLQTECPGAEKLDAYVLGRLSEAELESIEAHLANCPSCEASVQKLDGLDQLFNAAFRQPAAEEESFLDEEEFRQAVAAAAAVGDTADRKAASTLDQPGQCLGEYRILERLGRGGMATVHKAVHTRLQRIVALKILPADRGEDDEWTARFDREMVAIAALDDPHVVRVYDGREVEGRRILVMEYVEGLDLAQISRRLGPLRPADACEIIAQAAAGLQAAHQRGLVHRDIKPSNLMVSVRGEVKVLDLGLARFTGPAREGELTGTDQTLGTVDYMAPEQISDSRRVDIRADIYGLGCTLYKLLAGEAPYGHFHSLQERLMAHFHAQPKPLEEFRSDLPAGLADVVQRMMGKTAAQRYATPQEVAEALAPFRQGSSLAALVETARTMPDRAVLPTSPDDTGLSNSAATPEPPAVGQSLAAASNEPPSPPPAASSPRQPAAAPPAATSTTPDRTPVPPSPPPPAAPPEAVPPLPPRRLRSYAALAAAALVLMALVAWYAIAHGNKSVQGRVIGYDPAGATIVVMPAHGPATQGQASRGQAAPLIFHLGPATRVEAAVGPAVQGSAEQTDKEATVLEVGQTVEVTYSPSAIAGTQSQGQTVQASASQAQQQRQSGGAAHQVYEAIVIRILAPSPVQGEQ